MQQQYSWPGNVRQLRNVVEGLVVLSSGKTVSARNLPEEIRSASDPRQSIEIPLGSTVEEAERRLILATLAHAGGNRAAAARALGLGRKTLYRKLQQYGIETNDPAS